MYNKICLINYDDKISGPCILAGIKKIIRKKIDIRYMRLKKPYLLLNK